MSTKEFERQCKKTAKLARQHYDACKLLNDLFEARYGVSYSDHGDETLCDEFDYLGGDGLKIEEIDAIMASKL